jgi:hypothetical protein
MKCETCGDCRFWRKNTPAMSGMAGHCRRYPPFAPVGWRIYAAHGGRYEAEIESARFLNDAWPNTSADAWCGEYQPAPPAAATERKR